MVTLHLLEDGQGNLAATIPSGLVHGCTRFVGDAVVDEATWKDICTNPNFANQGRLNEFLKKLIPTKAEQVINFH